LTLHIVHVECKAYPQKIWKVLNPCLPTHQRALLNRVKSKKLPLHKWKELTLYNGSELPILERTFDFLLTLGDVLCE
jgi:hypothetical protein